MDKEKTYKMETRMMHGESRSAKWDYGHHVIPPLTKSTTFKLDSTARGHEGFVSFNAEEVAKGAKPPVYVYDRLGEPTIDMLEDMMKDAEGGEAGVAFSCGMAAISTTILSLTRAGKKVVSNRTLYGCTFSLIDKWLPRYGIETEFIDLTDLSQLEKAITPETTVVYAESPSNPTLEIVDLAAVRAVLDEINANRAPEDKIWLVVDNTFATPWTQRPLEHGADIVVESLTKNVGGFGVDMGGMAVVPASLIPDLKLLRKDLGGVLAPAAAWNIMVFGLGTLALRARRQQGRP
jgi:cystathionine beta-lyase/cystathionine gamma-synthase